MSYVITGNPGVGKHTISKRISRILDLEILDINKVAKDVGMLEMTGDTNDVDVIELEKVISKKILKPVLIVGHLAPYVISASQIKKAIVLRKNPYDLVEIYKGRGYSKEKIKENIGSEYLGIIYFDSVKKFGGDKTLQIDVTSQTINETVSKITDSINGKDTADYVDWLEKFSQKNDLKEFFAY